MKNGALLLILTVLCSGLLKAQNEEDYKKYLPETGDWCLGISAAPMFNYLGNMFNGTAQNSSPAINNVSTPFNNILNPGLTNSIFGKYVKTPNRYFRGRFQAAVTNISMVH